MTAVPEPSDAPRHDPCILRATQCGTWVVCSCGWKSRNGTAIYAQNEFGKHLLEQVVKP